MKKEVLTYVINGTEYKVFVTRKVQRNIYFRYKEDGFYVSAPNHVLNKDIIKGLDKFGLKLIKQFTCRNDNYSFEEDFLYLLGEKVSLSSLYLINEFYLNQFLKEEALKELTKLVRKYEQIMGIIEPYKVRVGHAKTRLGCNSKHTRTLTFQIGLIHYSEEIISSVVVHELAHEFHRNHQQEFYNCVYSYCPNYDVFDKKLRKGIKS